MCVEKVAQYIVINQHIIYIYHLSLKPFSMLTTLSQIIENNCLHTLQTIPAKTTLLSEGEVSQNIYFIKKGIIRMWFNKDGKDITLQFFMEH